MKRFGVLRNSMATVVCSLLTLTIVGMITAGVGTALAQHEGTQKETILRMHGSNTIGAELAPDLAEAFLKILGASEIKRIEIEPDTEINIEGYFPENKLIKIIEIRAHGSSLGFKSLEKEDCDIAMASRKIRPDEIDKLSFLGDMTDVASEHIFALDGIAIIVNPGNKALSNIDISTLADIFAGRIKNWAQVGGEIAPISLHGRDENSGTHDNFKYLVLEKNDLSRSAKRWDSNEKLSAAVAQDLYAIGYCGLPYVNQNKILKISDDGIAILPTVLSIATEDYPVTRRLYLYTPANPKNEYTRNFIAYVLGGGQKIIAANKLLPLTIRAIDQVVQMVERPQDHNVLNHYLDTVAGAKRISTNFRFKPDTYSLDARALRDLDRMVDFFAENNSNEIFLAGFTDNLGPYSYNYKLSCNRSMSIADELMKRGVKVQQALCVSEEVPVASNSTKAGRARNRRVEVWIKE